MQFNMLRIYKLNTFVRFGKYTNKPIHEIVAIDYHYLNWCLSYLEHFYISSESIAEIKLIQPLFSLTKEADLVIKQKIKKILDSIISKNEIYLGMILPNIGIDEKGQEYSYYDKEDMLEIKFIENLKNVSNNFNHISMEEFLEYENLALADSEEIYSTDRFYNKHEESFRDNTDWSNYNDDLDMDQQSEDFWNQF